jgi:hypothetical protein
MKGTKIIFWVTTSIIALFNILGLFFINSPQAIEGTKSLGLPIWFHTELTIGKGIGGLIILLPFFPKRIKEWAYVALGIDMLSAVIAFLSVFGFTPLLLSPIISFGLLLASYISYHKLNPR